VPTVIARATVKKRAATSAAIATRLLQKILNASGAIPSAEVSLLLVGDRRMRTLNRRFRGVDATTDVLSFSQTEVGPPLANPRLLGDIVVNLSLAAARARRWRCSPDEELAVLLTHGVLHLLGFDHHQRDAARAMAEAEMGVLAAIGRDPDRALVGRAFQ
jgi:probable rRNA maturation factor